MEITKASMISGKLRTLELDITDEQMYRWRQCGELIQNVMPNLTPDEREFLMTGITAEEWDAAFKDPEDTQWPPATTSNVL